MTSNDERIQLSGQSVPRRRDPKAKAARLSEAAVEAMAEDGYTNTTIHEICRRAGVSVGAFYDQFKSKAELIGQMARTEPVLLFTSDDLVDVSHIEAALREFLHGHRGKFWRAWREAVLAEPSFAKEDEEIAREIRSSLAATIRDARASQGVELSLAEATGLAWLIGALVRDALRRSWGRPEDVETLVARAVWVLLLSTGGASSTSDHSTPEGAAS